MNRFILPGIALLAFAGLLISIPFRRKRLLSKAGNLVFKLSDDFPIRPILIFFVCLVLIAVLPFRSFQLHIEIIFLLVALIGTEITVRSVASYKINGVYDKMVIHDTYAIEYDDIGCLPTVSYEDDPETENVDKRFLEILRQNGAQVILGFESEELRGKVLNEILARRPELKA